MSKHCLQQKWDAAIYYAGHGETKTGNWCFKDGTLSLQEILDTAKECNFNGLVYLYCACCYSGDWCIQATQIYEKYQGISVRISAASHPGEVAEMTPWMTLTNPLCLQLDASSQIHSLCDTLFIVLRLFYLF